MAIPSDSEPELLPAGTLLAGRLRVVRLLGAGGMGAVYEVEHELTKHRRALKLLHTHVAAVPEIRERFSREASAAGRIGNRHIVETFDAGYLETGEPYLVMELLSGEPLADTLERVGRLEFDAAIDVLSQTCRGVGAAHRAGIVHRDIKPDNIFLVRGDELFVKLLDFGISKVDAALTGAGQNLTQDGSTLGTPYYMSPEQIRGSAADIDERTDIYSLGVVLYECVTGKKPFLAETMMQLSVLIHEGELTDPRVLRPDLPEVLARVIRRAMHARAEERYQDVDELAGALSEAKAALDRHGSIRPVRGSSNPPAATTVGGSLAAAAELTETTLSLAPSATAQSLPPPDGIRDALSLDGNAEQPLQAEERRTRPLTRWVTLGAIAALTLLTGLWLLRSRVEQASDDPEHQALTNEAQPGRGPGERQLPANERHQGPPPKNTTSPPATAPPPSPNSRGDADTDAQPASAQGPRDASRSTETRTGAAPSAPAAPTPAHEHGLVEENPF